MQPVRPRFIPAACFLIAVQAFAQAPPEALNEWLDEKNRTNLELHGGNPDVLVRRELLADARHRFIDLYAGATGAGPDTAVDTFIATDTGDPQRTIAITPATPADVLAALEFIGMTPGNPIDLSKAQAWAKGERVVITFHTDDGNATGLTRSVRAEKLLNDVNWDETLPELGLRFVGPSNEAGPLPGDNLIATAFNSQNTILEVPYTVDRRAIAGQLVANGDYAYPAGQRLRIRIRPEFTGDLKRVHEYVAEIGPGEGPDAEQLSNLSVNLETPDGADVLSGDFESAYVFLESLIKEGGEPFLQLHFSDDLSAGSVRDVAGFVRRFLIEQDIRIEPSEPHLYFGAFLPNEAWRDPNRRGGASQPLEIHWGNAADFSGEIVQASAISAKRLGFTNVPEFEDAVRQGRPWRTGGVFMFVSPGVPYGRIRQAYELIRTEFPIVFVFM